MLRASILKKSKIPGYNRERFDLSGYLADHPLSDSSAEAAASVPAATSGASQPQATETGALPSTLLRGAPDIYRLPPCCLADAISAAVNPLLAALAPSIAGPSCTTSTTVTASPNNVLGSVFTIRNPIPSVSHTVTSAPATITRDPETPLRDEALSTPIFQPRRSQYSSYLSTVYPSAHSSDSRPECNCQPTYSFHTSYYFIFRHQFQFWFSPEFHDFFFCSASKFPARADSRLPTHFSGSSDSGLSTIHSV